MRHRTETETAEEETYDDDNELIETLKHKPK